MEGFAEVQGRGGDDMTNESKAALGLGTKAVYYLQL